MPFIFIWHDISKLLLKLIIIVKKKNKKFMTTLAKQNRQRNETNNLVDLFLNDDVFNFGFMSDEATSSPQYDIIENDNNYIIDLMLPGFKKDNISIDVNDGVLIIDGERKMKEVKYSRKGSFYGKFKKSFTLPENVNINKIDASYNDGILSITIPKEGESKLSKSIKIN